MKLSQTQKETILKTLQTRFEKNTHLHPKTKWEDVQKALEKNPEKLLTVFQMEESEGEPDVMEFENEKGIVFVDCSAESPKGRRSFCYDHQALEKRKEHKPKDSAINFAEKIGVELLSENEYRQLQKMGSFDLKTSSWIQTPENIRKLGGALFCDRRYDTVFVYHNGAESYYAARGFRAKVKI